MRGYCKYPDYTGDTARSKGIYHRNAARRPEQRRRLYQSGVTLLNRPDTDPHSGIDRKRTVIGKVIHQQIGHFQIQRTAAAPQRKHIGRMQLIRKRHLKYAGFVRQLPPGAIEKQHIHTLFLCIRNDGVRASGRVNIDRMSFLPVIIELIQDQFPQIGQFHRQLV